MLLAAAQHGVPVREATPNEVKSAIAGYGAADKEQVQRMVQLVLGMSELPRPDDAADALAIATWVANTDRGAALATAGVLDRAAVGADHPRRDRLRARRPRSAGRRGRARREAQRLVAPPVIASVEGVVGAVAADSLVHRGRRHRLSGLRGAGVLAAAQPGGRLKLHTYHLVREDQQALYGFRSTEELGFFTLLLTVNGVGPKVALAIVGSRPTPDLQLAIMAQDQAVLVAIPGIGKKLAERIIFELKEKVAAAGVSVSGPSVRRRCRQRGRDRRGAPGPRLFAGRGARSVAGGAGGRRRRFDPRGAGQGRAAEPAARLSATATGSARCYDAPTAVSSPSRTAMAAASVRESTPSLPRMFETWTPAVLSLMNSSSAMRRFV